MMLQHQDAIAQIHIKPFSARSASITSALPSLTCRHLNLRQLISNKDIAPIQDGQQPESSPPWRLAKSGFSAQDIAHALDSERLFELRVQSCGTPVLKKATLTS